LITSRCFDVREPEEYEQGAVPGAVHVPRGNLEFSVEGRLPDKERARRRVLRGGRALAFAAKTLQDLGYTDVVSIHRRFQQWKDEGLTWTTPQVLSADQRIRYQRHSYFLKWARRVRCGSLASKVLLLGAGGLGSPAALYLARPASARLGSSTWTSSTPRTSSVRSLHNVERVGMRKVDSAKMTLTAMNPDVKVLTYDTDSVPTTSWISSTATT